MDTVIKQISEIESAAAAVMDAANGRKKPLPKKWRKKLLPLTGNWIRKPKPSCKKIRAEMEVEMDSKLSKQKSDAKKVLAWMEKNYENHHTEYVIQLFQSMIKE